MKFETELCGAWEERGVIGTRVEIEKNELIVLWRGGVVLKCKYKATQDENGKITLKLSDNKLRYSGAYSSYASVTRIEYFDKKIEFEETFPITGKSVCVLERTSNSRYGNYDVVDGELLKSIQGEWKSDDGYYSLKFEKDTLNINGDELKIHVLRSRGSSPRGYQIVSADPSADMIHGLHHITFLGDSIVAAMVICDAPPIILKFERV